MSLLHVLDYSAFDLASRSVSITLPREIIFEVGGIGKLQELLSRLGVATESKVLGVIDPVLLDKPHLTSALSALRSAGYDLELFTKIEYEPSIDVAREVVRFTREVKPAAVVGIGGGSTLDLAKLASAALDNPGDVEDMVGSEKLRPRRTVLVLSPSTAGTGSEVTRYSVLTRGAAKTSVVSRWLLPDAAIVDPVLTYTMPPRVTVGTGLDAASHAIEAMISTDSNPFTDLLAYQAMKWIYRYLPRAYFRGDAEARYFMSLAATYAGVALNVARVVLGHSIAQTFGPAIRLHHGLSCGITLPYVMEFYLPVVKEKFAVLASYMGVDGGAQTIEERAARAVAAVWRLAEALEVPLSLRELGISHAELDKLAERTVKEWPRPNSPIELTKDRVLRVYEAMYEGRLRRVRV
ncbi:MAG: iron-containing alcohol dehydrogenase [Thermoproteota archaeon]